ncbi:MAG: hypothetical protein ACRDQZ_25515 [Mycobacteriales bacterium]
MAKRRKHGVVQGSDGAEPLSDDAIDLLRQANDVVKHVNHQNEHTRDLAGRIDEYLFEHEAEKSIKET